MKRLLALLLALAAFPALAQDDPPEQPARPPVRLIDNVYFVGTEGLGVYLIKTPAGDILIDVGMPGDASVVEKRIKRLGFKLSDIRIILNTHAHNDHAGGIAQVKRDTGAKVFASAADTPWLEHASGYPAVKVDRVIADGETVELGGVVLTAHLTPGHTPGCTTWTWPVTDADGSAHTVIDFCSASVGPNHFRPETYPGIVADYQKTFAMAKSIRGDVFLGPHLEFFDYDSKAPRLGKPGPNPFIDRAGYERQIDGWKAEFEDELKQGSRP